MRGAKNRSRGSARPKMTKGRPKISKHDEEEQSVALFESSIPTTRRSGKAQVVYDEDSASDKVSDSSAEQSSDDEDVNPMNELMSAIGADNTQHSTDESSSDTPDAGSDLEADSDDSVGQDELDDESDDDEEDDDEEDDSAEEEGDDSDPSMGNSSNSNDEETADATVRNGKRSVEEASDEDPVESGSDDELSLADSSYDEGVDEAAKDIPKKTVKSAKKLKPLDNAVDPDDTPTEEVKVKKKTAIAETIKSTDHFCKHFENDIDTNLVGSLCERKTWKVDRVELSDLGAASFSHVSDHGELVIPTPTATLPSLGLRSRLFNLIGKTLKQQCSVKQTTDQEPTLSAEQRQFFYVINQYKDFYNPNQTFDNMEEYRMVYCLHSLNHILKTRLRVTLNSEEKWSSENKKQNIDREYRDQGLTRPKVLILAPFKESARRIVNMFEALLMTKKKSFVTNKKRFTEEFSPLEDGGIDPKKPEDYMKMFEGNTDDCFRLGIQLSKSGMKMYADFYKADILVCSPLGLRMILGADGDLKRDYDFMSSIEVLIVDQADVYLMQNWDHVLHLMGLLHVQPKQSRDTDFSRIRMWTLDGHSKHYRQTIVQSCVHSPEISALFTQHCSNQAGEVRLQPLKSNGSICHIVSQMPLIFQRFACTHSTTLADDRFTYFVKEVLPQYTVKERAGTLIYVPSYYDYVRLRNYLHKEKLDTSLVCEYTTDKAIRRAKKKFFTKETHFMLYTERVHFFRRMQLRKIRHLIFYSLPTYPQFFSDVCNMYRTTQQADASCLVLFSDLEAYKLAMCVGTDRTRHIISNKKNLFMFVTGDE